MSRKRAQNRDSEFSLARQTKLFHEEKSPGWTSGHPKLFANPMDTPSPLQGRRITRRNSLYVKSGLSHSTLITEKLQRNRSSKSGLPVVKEATNVKKHLSKPSPVKTRARRKSPTRKEDRRELPRKAKQTPQKDRSLHVILTRTPSVVIKQASRNVSSIALTADKKKDAGHKTPRKMARRSTSSTDVTATTKMKRGRRSRATKAEVISEAAAVAATTTVKNEIRKKPKKSAATDKLPATCASPAPPEYRPTAAAKATPTSTPPAAQRLNSSGDIRLSSSFYRSANAATATPKERRRRTIHTARSDGSLYKSADMTAGVKSTAKSRHKLKTKSSKEEDISYDDIVNDSKFFVNKRLLVDSLLHERRTPTHVSSLTSVRMTPAGRDRREAPYDVEKTPVDSYRTPKEYPTGKAVRMAAETRGTPKEPICRQTTPARSQKRKLVEDVKPSVAANGTPLKAARVLGKPLKPNAHLSAAPPVTSTPLHVTSSVDAVDQDIIPPVSEIRRSPRPHSRKPSQRRARPQRQPVVDAGMTVGDEEDDSIGWWCNVM